MLLSALKVAVIAQLTVLSLGCVGALCAHKGIFEVPVLKKLSLLLTRVLLPALALGFYKHYSSFVLFDFGCVFLMSSLHILVGLLVGHAAARIRRIPTPFAQIMALTCALPHPALPVAMLPSIIDNWDMVAGDPTAKPNGLSTVGIYLTVVLCCFASVVSLELHFMTKQIQTAAAPPGKRATTCCSATPPTAFGCIRAMLRWAARQDPTLPCCFGGLLIGVIEPLKNLLEPRGALSWLAGTVAQTGSMSPAMSIFIIGGLVWNTRKAALKQKLKAVEAAKKKALESGDSEERGRPPRLTLAGAGAAVLRQLKKSPAATRLNSPESITTAGLSPTPSPPVEPSSVPCKPTAVEDDAMVHATKSPTPPKSPQSLASIQKRMHQRAKSANKVGDASSPARSPGVASPCRTPSTAQAMLVESASADADDMVVSATASQLTWLREQEMHMSPSHEALPGTKSPSPPPSPPEAPSESDTLAPLASRAVPGSPPKAFERSSTASQLHAAPTLPPTRRRTRSVSHEGYDLVPRSHEVHVTRNRSRRRSGEEGGTVSSPGRASRRARLSSESYHARLSLTSITEKIATLTTDKEEAAMDSTARAEREKERSRLASEMWAAAYSSDEKKVVVANSSGGAAPALAAADAAKPPTPQMNMREFIVICCACKLIIMPALCIALNAAMFRLGAIPDIPILRMVLDMYPAIPTAAALVARFNGAGYDDAARYCATCMLPMYMLSIPSIAVVIVISSSLINA